MRALALLLAAVNLFYFAWVQWIEAPPPAPSFSGKDIPSLTLASERPAPPKPAVVAPPTVAQVENAKPAAAEQVVAPQCSSVGPFQDLPSAVQASAALKSAGLESHQRMASGELWVGYWVSVQNLAARDQADRAVATLKEHGVGDAYVVPGSDPPNTVSLGVFREQERAHRLVEDAKKLGLSARMTDRTRPGAVYWVDVTLADANQKLDMTLLGAQPGKIVRLEVRECPNAAASG